MAQSRPAIEDAYTEANPANKIKAAGLPSFSKSTALAMATSPVIDEYLDKITWKAAENSNVTFSLQGLSQHIATSIVEEYWLHQLYSEEIREYVKENRFHIHDLGYLSAYCSGWSTENILIHGFGGVPNKLQCRPPKHFNTALNQIVNFLFTLQGEMAGAQALSNLDTYIAPFIRVDELSYTDVFKFIQSFVYSLNVPTRSGFQAPFTNISLDLVCSSILAEQPVIIGGRQHPTWVYGDFQEEIDMFNKAFAEVMIQGDGNGSIFSFPIPTYNLSKEFDWDSPRFKPMWEMTAKYGVPYFANFINSDLNPADFRSMCCRLRLDTRKLHTRAGGIFGATPLTGSLGVVTLNLPNLAVRSKSVPKFFDVIKETIAVAKESLEIKRKVIESNMELYPYTRFYLKSVYQRAKCYWANHFSTIGVIGMNEACSILLGRGIYHNKDFAGGVLQFIKDELQEIQLETKHLYNLEATPAESTCYKLAKIDHELFPDVKLPEFYTNSTMLPVDSTDDLFEALTHQESLQNEYTGGTVFHAFLGERLSSWTQARDLVKSITTTYRIPYVTLTPTFSICRTHGYLAGEHFECPQCGEKSLVYSRIVGYFRPVSDWNAGKKVEFSMRKIYTAIQNEPIDFQIGGFTKTTYTDFPGKPVASILFTKGCNLKCGWCHNSDLVSEKHEDLDPHTILDYVAATEHRSLVICGGEPTIQSSLMPFLRRAKELGITVKLDSNGSNPNVLQKVFDEHLVDFVAMDVKANPERYAEVAGKPLRPKLLMKSIDIIKKSGVKHQFRTTVVPGLIDIEDITVIKGLIGEMPMLQRFRPSESCIDAKFRKHQEHTEEEFETIIKTAKKL
ncbi:hypothetical protein PI124_g2531 [Phytophthora idaei]|nr:hypothetical protein PI125_g6015 [Phytophthora idaei]KAG3164041.1 hypothetical protein PI126_g5282 [Phytophthora idaei]KAG3252886.1 hypothetical protein PI124_g2531 [Phytophthora idaei]